jgi:hypothetical protein
MHAANVNIAAACRKKRLVENMQPLANHDPAHRRALF